MPKVSARKNNEIHALRQELQFLISELQVHGPKPDQKIAARNQRVIFGKAIPLLAPAPSSPEAWLAVVQDENDGYPAVTWDGIPYYGIATDGMLVEPRVVFNPGGTIAWPEPYFVRVRDCQDPILLTMLITLAKKRLAY